MKFAPVIIPTLCREVHFIRLIESLKRNEWAKYTDVYVSIDYPPADKYRGGWNNICKYVEKGDFSAFASFNVFKQEKNLGAAYNNWFLTKFVLEHYDRWILFNDDAEVSRNFLEFIDKCLDEFENDPDVVAVTGYSYPVTWDLDNTATCFKQNFNASVWGTGFWKSKRQLMGNYIWSGGLLKDLDRVMKEESYKRMIDASLREYIPAAVRPIKKLNRMMLGLSDIGLRAYLAVENKFFISPAISKVRDHGFDGSGVYCQNINDGQNGNTAGTYNYSQQPIDEGTTFDLVLDTKNNIQENRDRLNKFDVRTPAQMRRTKLYLWLMTHIGVWAGKECAYLLLPFDITMLVWKKLLRRLS